jgi:uncharacterized protein YeaO (DUF488 family)
VSAVRAARVQDRPAPGEGTRVLVDRLWPRGLRKDEAPLDAWLKDAAPSTELRRWFHGPGGDWETFAERYRAELTAPGPAADAVARLRELAARGPLLLLTAARDPDRSHAAVLAAHLGA